MHAIERVKQPGESQEALEGKKGATQDSGNEDEYFAIAVLPILPEWVASDEPKYLREDYSTSPCLLLMHR